jgi:hypothetical protein
MYAFKLINGEEGILRQENRGRYHRADVFDIYPELKEDIREYTIEQVSKKNSIFTLDGLMRYSIDRLKFYNSTITSNLHLNSKILDKVLTPWGFFWGKNKARPYFSGHELVDVVKYRKTFVDYFFNNQNSYYIHVKDAITNLYSVVQSTNNYRIIAAHDESTFRSGEIQSERWLHHDFSPLFNKGIQTKNPLAFHSTQILKFSNPKEEELAK